MTNSSKASWYKNAAALTIATALSIAVALCTTKVATTA